MEQVMIEYIDAILNADEIRCKYDAVIVYNWSDRASTLYPDVAYHIHTTTRLTAIEGYWIGDKLYYEDYKHDG